MLTTRQLDARMWQNMSFDWDKVKQGGFKEADVTDTIHQIAPTDSLSTYWS